MPNTKQSVCKTLKQHLQAVIIGQVCIQATLKLCMMNAMVHMYALKVACQVNMVWRPAAEGVYNMHALKLWECGGGGERGGGGRRGGEGREKKGVRNWRAGTG